MTRQLEELFELPEAGETNNDQRTLDIQSLDEINQQLPNTDITDLSSSDSEMDQLASKAIDHYENLMDLGMNVEPRFSAPIFEAASKLLGHAITAKTNKIDKKLKAIDLELKKRRLELQERQAEPKDPHEVSEDGIRELDRNALLAFLRNKGTDTEAN